MVSQLAQRRGTMLSAAADLWTEEGGGCLDGCKISQQKFDKLRSPRFSFSLKRRVEGVAKERVQSTDDAAKEYMFSSSL